MDFILKLTEKSSENRLGSTNDYEEVLSHDFLKDYDIEAIKEKKTKGFWENIDQETLEP